MAPILNRETHSNISYPLHIATLSLGTRVSEVDGPGALGPAPTQAQRCIHNAASGAALGSWRPKRVPLSPLLPLGSSSPSEVRCPGVPWGLGEELFTLGNGSPPTPVQAPGRGQSGPGRPRPGRGFLYNDRVRMACSSLGAAAAWVFATRQQHGLRARGLEPA